MNHPAVRDAALLLLRLALGIIFIAHGWQKVFIDGMNGTGGTIAQLEKLGVPQPGASAWLVSGLEMLGGALLIIGLLTTAVATMLIIYMAAVVWFVHWGHGFFTADGGFELAMLTMMALFVIVVFGAGRASLDRALSRFS